MNFAFKAAGLAATLALGAGIAAAGPIITIAYDPGVTFSVADKAVIQDAVAFYTANMTSNLSLTLAFGAQAKGETAEADRGIKGHHARGCDFIARSASGS
jgi:hypothetical protein